MSQKTSPGIERAVISDYSNGVLVAEIEKRYNISRPTIYRILRTVGPGVNRSPGMDLKPFSPAEMIHLKKLRELGWTKEELLVEFKTGYDRLNRGLEVLGLDKPLERRDRKERLPTQGGYVYILIGPDDPMYEMGSPSGDIGWGRYVFEHRIVMARSLGRPLTPRETVHHINGDRTDNRLENLQLRQGAHGKGVRMTCHDCGSHNVGPVELH